MTDNSRASKLSPVVEQIGRLHLEGDIIPHSWFQTPRLRYESGKPNLSAIALLADVIYWQVLRRVDK